MELVNKYGKSWSKISKVLISRNGKQIRDRYINILDPSIKKEKFALDEDLKLLTLYKKLGPRWATISKFFENRTADMVKNRFHSSIKKNMKFLEDIDYEYSCPVIKQEQEQDCAMSQECAATQEESENKIGSNYNESEESTNYMNFMPENDNSLAHSLSASMFAEDTDIQFTRKKRL